MLCPGVIAFILSSAGMYCISRKSIPPDTADNHQNRLICRPAWGVLTVLVHYKSGCALQ